MRQIIFLLLLTLSLCQLSLGILNRQDAYCNSHYDCGSQETLLTCVEGQCKCPSGSSNLYVNGVYLKMDLEWSYSQTKCVARHGSLCTYKGQSQPYYSSSNTNIECKEGFSCFPQFTGSSSGSGSSSTNTRQYNYQNQYPYQRFQQQDNSGASYGICWNGNQGQNQGTGISGSGTFPILQPSQYPTQDLPNRHEFATHSQHYPLNPNRLDKSAGKQGQTISYLTIFCGALTIFITIL